VAYRPPGVPSSVLSLFRPTKSSCELVNSQTGQLVDAVPRVVVAGFWIFKIIEGSLPYQSSQETQFN